MEEAEPNGTDGNKNLLACKDVKMYKVWRQETAALQEVMSNDVTDVCVSASLELELINSLTRTNTSKDYFHL